MPEGSSRTLTVGTGVSKATDSRDLARTPAVLASALAGVQAYN